MQAEQNNTNNQSHNPMQSTDSPSQATNYLANTNGQTGLSSNQNINSSQSYPQKKKARALKIIIPIIAIGFLIIVTCVGLLSFLIYRQNQLYTYLDDSREVTENTYNSLLDLSDERDGIPNEPTGDDMLRYGNKLKDTSKEAKEALNNLKDYIDNTEASGSVTDYVEKKRDYINKSEELIAFIDQESIYYISAAAPVKKYEDFSIQYATVSNELFSNPDSYIANSKELLTTIDEIITAFQSIEVTDDKYIQLRDEQAKIIELDKIYLEEAIKATEERNQDALIAADEAYNTNLQSQNEAYKEASTAITDELKTLGDALDDYYEQIVDEYNSIKETNLL